MTRRPPLAEHRPAISVGQAGPGHVPSHLFDTEPSPANADQALAGSLPLQVGGAGTVLAIDPHGKPVSVRLFRSSSTRVMLVGSPRCAQLIAFRTLAAGASVVVGTARPQVWAPLGRQTDSVTIQPVDAEGTPTGRRTRPLLYLDDAPPYGAVPDIPVGRWTTALTIREALTHREAQLLDSADLVLLQPLVPAEVDVAASVLKAPGVDQRLSRLPADVLTVVHRREVRWGRLSVTAAEKQFFGHALRR